MPKCTRFIFLNDLSIALRGAVKTDYTPEAINSTTWTSMRCHFDCVFRCIDGIHQLQTSWCTSTECDQRPTLQHHRYDFGVLQHHASNWLDTRTSR